MAGPHYTYGYDFSSELDQIRYHIRDTDEADWILSDEEIAYAASQDAGSIYSKAAAAARAAKLELGRRLSISGDASIKSREQFDMMDEVEKDLTRRAARAAAMPYAGGLVRSEVDTNRADETLVQSAFTEDLHLKQLDALISTDNPD